MDEFKKIKKERKHQNLEVERLRAASRELEANRLRNAEEVIAQLKQEFAGNLKENK